MLEGPVHHAIKEGWWPSAAEYLVENKRINQGVIGVLNLALETGLKTGFKNGSTIGNSEIQKWVNELPTQVKNHEELVELIRMQRSRKSKKAAEVLEKILVISAIYTQINFQFVALWVDSISPEIADSYLKIMKEQNWIHRLYNNYIDAVNESLETSNWRPFMNKDMKFDTNLDFHILKLSALYKEFETK